MYILKNNTLAVHSISIGGNTPSIVLIPGENKLTKEQFETILSHPIVKERISIGKYSFVNRKVENVPVNSVEEKSEEVYSQDLESNNEVLECDQEGPTVSRRGRKKKAKENLGE